MQVLFYKKILYYSYILMLNASLCHFCNLLVLYCTNGRARTGGKRKQGAEGPLWQKKKVKKQQRIEKMG